MGYPLLSERWTQGLFLLGRRVLGFIQTSGSGGRGGDLQVSGFGVWGLGFRV